MSRMNHDYHFGLVCLSLPAVYRGAVCGQSADGIYVPATVLTPARRVAVGRVDGIGNKRKKRSAFDRGCLGDRADTGVFITYS
jgi:hypothetical protein